MLSRRSHATPVRGHHHPCRGALAICGKPNADANGKTHSRELLAFQLPWSPGSLCSCSASKTPACDAMEETDELREGELELLDFFLAHEGAKPGLPLDIEQFTICSSVCWSSWITIASFFEGEMTCCRRCHVDGMACDREISR